MSKNAHGLDRSIPKDVKRAVRQRCGFGCARCGATIYEYEHFFPDFKDALSHDASSIVLLCPSCHSLVTKGVLPKEQVAEFSEKPAALARGFSNQSLPVFRGVPSLKMGGGGLIKQTPIPIQLGGKPLISFFPPEDGSEITQLSFFASDSSGENLLEVINNEWKIQAGVWDFEWVGKRFQFKDSSGQPALVLRLEPPDFIAVEIFRSCHNGVPLEITEEAVRYGGITLIDNICSGCQVGLSFN